MDSDRNFHVFREGRTRISAGRLLASLRRALGRVRDEQSCVSVLLRCGELECGLADTASPAAPLLAAATDICAEALVSGEYGRAAEVASLLPETVEEMLDVSAPEGFAYYALHPRQYAEVVKQLPDVADAVVIGIRSIGTTLSAMTRAALRTRGTRVVRFSVRPTGEPFNRRLQWTPEQLEQLNDGLRRDVQFFVADEGPGLSGSSFLSVAEALCGAGVAKQRITLIPSHQPDLTTLCASNAESRWAQFACTPVPQCMRPEGDWIGGGEWRQRFIGGDDALWPGAWTSMERAKFLSPDERIVWKFEGLGPYGTRARAQAEALAQRGFGARVLEDEAGFLGYEFIAGSMLHAGDCSPESCEALASYCAFRAENFVAEASMVRQSDLETMLRVNFEREFGEALPPALAELELVRPVFCDGKMSAHEWVRGRDGRLLKFDTTVHGDDHFFPGPCDAAWDLAGVVVEWCMDGEQRQWLLSRYADRTGDEASGRITNYLLAYSVFRMAWTKTAAAAMKGTADEPRLLRESAGYRAYAKNVAAFSACR